MFSNPRRAVERIDYVQGVDEQSQRHTLNYHLWATGGMNQARSQIRRMARHAKSCNKACKQIAKRIKRQRPEIHTIEITRGHFDPLRYFGQRETAPLATELRCSCKVPR